MFAPEERITGMNPHDAVLRGAGWDLMSPATPQVQSGSADLIRHVSFSAARTPSVGESVLYFLA